MNAMTVVPCVIGPASRTTLTPLAFKSAHALYASGTPIARWPNALPCRSSCVPVMGQLDHRVIFFVAIADKCESELSTGKILFAQQLHPELLAVELQRFVKVVDANHGVQQLHG